MTSARSFGLTVTGTSGGQELVLCPFHPDRHSSAWWHPTKNLFYCAVCGFGLNAQQLAKRLGVEYEEVIEWSAEPEEYNLVDESEPWNLGGDIYHDYFRERGIHEKVIKEYGLRWMNTEPKGAVILLTSTRGEVQGVQYRYQDADRAGTRYKTYGKVPPVWPMHKLIEKRVNTPLLIVEGVWSVLRLETFNYNHPEIIPFRPFALLGAKANEEIVNVLKPFRPLYLYDADEAGKRACKKMRELDPLTPCFVSKSPDDMKDNEIAQLYGAIAVKLMEYKVHPPEEVSV